MQITISEALKKVVSLKQKINELDLIMNDEGFELMHQNEKEEARKVQAQRKQSLVELMTKIEESDCVLEI